MLFATINGTRFQLKDDLQPFTQVDMRRAMAEWAMEQYVATVYPDDLEDADVALDDNGKPLGTFHVVRVDVPEYRTLAQIS